MCVRAHPHPAHRQQAHRPSRRRAPGGTTGADVSPKAHRTAALAHAARGASPGGRDAPDLTNMGGFFERLPVFRSTCEVSSTIEHS